MRTHEIGDRHCGATIIARTRNHSRNRFSKYLMICLTVDRTYRVIAAVDHPSWDSPLLVTLKESISLTKAVRTAEKAADGLRAWERDHAAP